MKPNQPLPAPIAHGRTAEVYDWGEEHILKLYHDWCPPEWIEREASVARIIAKAGIPTAAVGEIIEMDGRRGIIYERLTGVSMLQDMNRRPWMLLRHARALADLQARFRQISIPGLVSYHAGLGHSIRRAPHIPEPQREKTLALLQTLPDEKTLCHGDFHPGNIILSARGPVVIDWMTASSGSPWADVARSSMILTIGVKGAGKAVHPALRLLIGLFHQTYLNHFHSLLPNGHAELKRWQPVIAAARLDEQIAVEREALLQIIADGLNSTTQGNHQ